MYQKLTAACPSFDCKTLSGGGGGAGGGGGKKRKHGDRHAAGGGAGADDNTELPRMHVYWKNKALRARHPTASRLTSDTTSSTTTTTATATGGSGSGSGGPVVYVAFTLVKRNCEHLATVRALTTLTALPPAAPSPSPSPSPLSPPRLQVRALAARLGVDAASDLSFAGTKVNDALPPHRTIILSRAALRDV